MASTPIDPTRGDRYILAGKIVTMDAHNTVIPQGALYIEGATIVAVQPRSNPRPAGFAGAPVITTGGTIYPGLIELHNHLSYNVLPLWQVPKRFDNREQWRGIPDYRKLISGPMRLLVDQPGYSEAIVRFVECKCLLGGVTTSQGLTLSSAPGIPTRYRGVVRNVERTDDAALPAARTRVDDVDTAEDFAVRLHASSCLLLHLSEGVDARARTHFLRLQQADGAWAISPALAGIHATGLAPDDWTILAQHGGSAIWSPLSNLLLYGATINLAAARASGARLALGSDWSPSGSKNLLHELKIAALENTRQGSVFSLPELVAMATIQPARVLGWDASLGSLESGKRADLFVIHRSQGDPYRRLLRSDEDDITLVVIDGCPRVGTPRLMRRFAGPTEAWTVGGQPRLLHLADPAGDAIVGALTLTDAVKRLRTGMAALPTPPPIPPPAIGAGAAPLVDWTLELDENEGLDLGERPLLPLTAALVADLALAESVALETLVEPIVLDALTVADDRAAYCTALIAQPNLPAPLAQRISTLYQ